ncbi:quinoprotein relay system zinc metallohydrolase 2 [Fulvimarina sp. MAC3]|uniref:quinoprotein relay system zinc metallohydrolase 2 n=1 Tax=Fulvimarina sp. MAC3 TaxID=3148887 RepID=UPI0031FD405F
MCRFLEDLVDGRMSADRGPTRRRFLCLAGPFVALPWFPGLALAAPASDAAADPLDVTEIADGVFVHHGVVDLMRSSNEGGVANIGFIIGDDGVAVIDSGGSVLEGRRMVAAIAERTDKPIRYVINTHMHPDHIFGNAAYAGGDATFVGHHNLPNALAARRETYLRSNLDLMGADFMAEVSIIPPTLTVAEETVLDLGNRKLTLRAWPTAHTNNDLTVMDETTRTLFTGDLVFQDHCPSLDGSILGWTEVLGNLTAIEADHAVPGHGPIDIAWPSGADPQIRYLDVLTRDVRQMIDEGVPLAEASTTAGQSQKDDWQLFDDFNVRNATAAYAELEWE